jgi:rhamnose utilization protein RhaD (predicted bifunctional aldolase and dehydrogenase)
MGLESNWAAIRTRFRLRWDAAAARSCRSDLDLRAYGSRLLGADASLVMQGGGNTSIKGHWSDGRSCVWVKGTGADLSRVGPEHFTPIDRLRACALLDGPPLDNAGLAAALVPLKFDAAAPRPSIETLMHAFLPARFVEHTHADSVLAVLNTESGAALAGSLFGGVAPLVPFRHSGFELASACRDTICSHGTPATRGLLLAFHGAVAFADDARVSCERMGALVARAEAWLEARDAWLLPRAEAPVRDAAGARCLAELRLALSRAAGFPMVLVADGSPEAAAFSRRADLASVALQGPPTPQHAIFTKRVPALGLDVEGYADAYRDYLAAHGGPYAVNDLPDPVPRMLVDPRFGVISASIDGLHARIVAEVAAHDIAIASRAAAHGRYLSLAAPDILAAEVHYGGHERRRLARRGTDLPLLGCVVLATGVLPVPVVRRIEAAGADIIRATRVTDAVLVDAAHDFGGVDVVVSTGHVRSSLLDHLLAHSPAGGLACTPTAPDALFDTLATHWKRTMTGS